MPEEYLDVLDEKGNLTGEKKLRSEVHSKGLWHRVVHVWIVNSKGELIVQKRNELKESYPGLWDISSAGHISAGDSSLESASRELEEELGLVPEQNQFQLIFTTKIESFQNNNKYINREFIDVYLIEMEVELEKLKLQEEEVSAVKYIHYKDLLEAFKRNDPTYVPCSFENGYGKLFDILAAKYK